jgi:hypothetical protein
MRTIIIVVIMSRMKSVLAPHTRESFNKRSNNDHLGLYPAIIEGLMIHFRCHDPNRDFRGSHIDPPRLGSLTDFSGSRMDELHHMDQAFNDNGCLTGPRRIELPRF